MNNFKCPKCYETVYFENTSCLSCNTLIGYNPKTDEFEFVDINLNNNERLKYCKNFNLSICNWLIDINSENLLCKACELNRMVPNYTDKPNFQKWQKLEVAKHRLIYQLIKLGLPTESKLKNNNGIAFDFLAEKNPGNVVTGHADGVITILLSEADSVNREILRKQMNEPYRTLLGHFRHEIGHYYWQLLFNEDNLDKFRALFGDERVNYNQALNNHYNEREPNNWESQFITAYASSHPWEDWAETWAHYLHIMDTLETANTLGILIRNSGVESKNELPDPYQTKNFKDIYEASVALTTAVNSLNRSMGIADIYPFTIPQPVFNKLNFIHNLLNCN